MTCLRQGRASDPPGRPTVALKTKCVVAGFLLRYPRRHARLPFWVLRPVRPRSSSLSFICQWAHEVSNERRAQVVVPAGIEPARRHYFQAHRRGACTPSLTERNGTIHGPDTCFPYLHRVVAKAKCRLAKVLANLCGTRHADRYISRPTRPAHLLVLGIYRARLNPVSGRLNPSLCRQGKSSVFLHGTYKC